MKKYAIPFVRIALILITIPVILVLGYALPQVVMSGMDELTESSISSAPLVFVLIGVMYVSAIPFFLSLFQANKFLQSINRQQLFSSGSIQALRKIKLYSFSFAIIYILALPLLYLIAQWDNAPGFIIFGFLFIGLAFVSAAFANMLEVVVEEGIRLEKGA